MILSTFKLTALCGLCSLAAPAWAADTRAPETSPNAAEASRAEDSSGTDDVRASHSRRVELPFLLDFRPAEQAPVPTAPRTAAPHPYRQLQLDGPLRAAIGGDFGPAHRLAAIERG